MKKQFSTFDTWFREQHGEPPSSKTLEELRKDVFNAKLDLAKAETLLFAADTYSLRETSALWAWQAVYKQGQ